MEAERDAEALLPARPLDGAAGPRRALGRTALRPAGAADRSAGTAHLHRHDALHPRPATAPSSASPAPPRSRRRSSSAPARRPTRRSPKCSGCTRRVKGSCRRPAGAHPPGTRLLRLRPGADALDPGGDRRLRPGDVRDAGAAAATRTSASGSGRTTSASASSSACRAARCPAATVEFKAWFDGRLASPDLQATEHGLEMAPLVAFRQPVPAAARGNIALQNHIIKGTLPPRVREIFGIRWSRAHESSFRAMAATHRRARGAFPHRMRRGRNDVFFDVVTETERARGGTATPQLGARLAPQLWRLTRLYRGGKSPERPVRRRPRSGRRRARSDRGSGCRVRSPGVRQPAALGVAPSSARSRPTSPSSFAVVR